MGIKTHCDRCGHRLGLQEHDSPGIWDYACSECGFVYKFYREPKQSELIEQKKIKDDYMTFIYEDEYEQERYPHLALLNDKRLYPDIVKLCEAMIKADRYYNSNEWQYATGKEQEECNKKLDDMLHGNHDLALEISKKWKEYKWFIDTENYFIERVIERARDGNADCMHKLDDYLKYLKKEMKQ